jgi:hypothetical protein
VQCARRFSNGLPTARVAIVKFAPRAWLGSVSSATIAAAVSARPSHLSFLSPRLSLPFQIPFLLFGFDC